MNIRCIWEHNGNDTLLYDADLPGGFARGADLNQAVSKMKEERNSWLRWLGFPPQEAFELEIIQEKNSELDIRDADSDVLFELEKEELTPGDYEKLKRIALKSAADFQALYDSVPDKDASCLPERQTFYGQAPRTAREMYLHTKNVNEYYFAQINVDIDNEGTILDCRRRGFEALEGQPDFLSGRVYTGSYDEQWSLRKVLRRFIWHDRIHARAMYRMAVKTFGADAVPNIFQFDL